MLQVPAFLFTIGVCSEYEACLAHCPSTLAPAAVSDMQRTAALLVGNAMHSLAQNTKCMAPGVSDYRALLLAFIFLTSVVLLLA